MGEPEDVQGECNARLFIGDNFNDNHATMRCQLELGHSGMHEEKYGREPQRVIVQWEVDEREEPTNAK